MRSRIVFIAFLTLAMLALGSCEFLRTLANQGKNRDRCGHMIGYEERLLNDATFRNNMERLENATQQYIERINREGSDFRTTVVTIPVVVHVVSKNATENISAAQIQSQIDVLNRDFRRLNADFSAVPAAFQPSGADAMIQFALAQRDPSCGITNGITRTTTTVASFGHSNSASPTVRNPVKFASSGGHDAWPSGEYLNLWVCDLTGGLLGYGSWPADQASRPAEDGVVIDFRAFGNTGTATAPFNLGRTGSHEIGHWLNLRHIWGDNPDCIQDDLVGDTPIQASQNTGCPTFPHITCSNGPNGDMFMNQMDYSDDACLLMFTQGQSDRMSATLYIERNSILGSQGALPPPAVASADLFIKDTDADVGNEPNTESSDFYISDDIWVRKNNDGLINQEHQNPNGDQLNHIYVRVRNKGCNTASGGDLKLYWAKASTGLSWPFPWTGALLGSVPIGNPVGVQSIGSIGGGSSQIFHFTWTAPDPSDYASFGADKAHFCLLARIETSSASPFGMTFPETSDLGGNVRNNNNIAWKNIGVDDIDGDGRLASVLLANYSTEKVTNRINFDFTEGKKENLLRLGSFEVELDKKLANRIQAEGLPTKGLEPLGGNRYKVVDSRASIQNLALEKNELYYCNIRFTPNQPNIEGTHVVVEVGGVPAKRFFTVNVEQADEQTGRVIGGQQFKFKHVSKGK